MHGFHDRANTQRDECSQTEKYVDVFEAVKKSLVHCPLEAVTIEGNQPNPIYPTVGAFGAVRQGEEARFGHLRHLGKKLEKSLFEQVKALKKHN